MAGGVEGQGQDTNKNVQFPQFMQKTKKYNVAKKTHTDAITRPVKREVIWLDTVLYRNKKHRRQWEYKYIYKHASCELLFGLIR